MPKFQFQYEITKLFNIIEDPITGKKRIDIDKNYAYIIQDNFDRIQRYVRELVNATNVKARAYLGTNQMNISASTYVTVLLDTENYDIGADFGTTNYRFTAPVSGYYSISVSVYLYGVIANESITGLRVLKNNTTSISRKIINVSGANLGFSIDKNDTCYLEANDYIELQAYSANTGTDILLGTDLTFMSIHLLSV